MKKRVVSGAVVALVLGMQGAEAGFKWAAPVAGEPAVAQSAPVVPVAPVAEVVAVPEVVPVPVEAAKPVEAKPVAAVPVEAAKPVTEAVPVEAVKPVEVVKPVEAAKPVEGLKLVAPVTGFGSDIPLSVALKQIVPAGQDLRFAEGVNQDQRVSWQGGKGWREVLAEVISPLGLESRMDGQAIVIAAAGSAKEAPVVAAPAVPVAPKAEPMTDETMLAEVQAIGEESPKAEAPKVADKTAAEELAAVADGASAPLPVVSVGEHGEQVAETPASAEAMQEWIVPRGETLRQVLEDWAQTAGWVTVWDSPYNYNIEASATFQGSFTEAASDLVRAFSKASPPVAATFYRNNTVVITTLSNGEVD